MPSALRHRGFISPGLLLDASSRGQGGFARGGQEDSAGLRVALSHSSFLSLWPRGILLGQRGSQVLQGMPQRMPGESGHGASFSFLYLPPSVHLYPLYVAWTKPNTTQLQSEG